MIEKIVKVQVLMWHNQKREELEHKLSQLGEKLDNCDPENGRNEFHAIGEQYINVEKQLQGIIANINSLRR